MTRHPKPHLFTPDPDVPARYSADGHLLNLGACRCGLVGEPGDAHHTLPPAPAEADGRQRAAGDTTYEKEN